MCIFWWVSTINGNGRKVGQRKIKSGYIICRNLETFLSFVTKIRIPQFKVYILSALFQYLTCAGGTCIHNYKLH